MASVLHTIEGFNFLWLDLRLWLDKHLLRHTVRQYECLTRPCVEYRDLLLALWLSRKDCVHSPDVLLRRWAETENFHPNQLLRAERKILTPGVDNGICDYRKFCAKGAAASCIDRLRGLSNADKKRNIHTFSLIFAGIKFIINEAEVLRVPFPGRV